MNTLGFFSCALVLSGIAACTTMPVLDAPPASDFSPLSIPDRTFAAEDRVIAHYVPAPTAKESKDEVRITREIGRDGTGSGTHIILVTAEGYADDSVSGEQWRIVLDDVGSDYRVVEAGVRYQCARGANPGWSKSPCP